PRGDTTVKEYEHVDENGNRRSTVHLTQPQQQPDGSIKEMTTSHSLADLTYITESLQGRGVRNGTQTQATRAGHQQNEDVKCEQAGAEERPTLDEKVPLTLALWKAAGVPRKYETVRLISGESSWNAVPAEREWAPRNGQRNLYLLVEPRSKDKGVVV